MRVVILYHPKAEFAGMAEDYKKDFERRHPGKTIEMASLDTVEGSDMAALYDVVRYPAILAVASDGSLQRLWQDQPFPMMDEVSAYLAPDYHPDKI